MVNHYQEDRDSEEEWGRFWQCLLIWLPIMILVILGAWWTLAHLTEIVQFIHTAVGG